MNKEKKNHWYNNEKIQYIILILILLIAIIFIAFNRQKEEKLNIANLEKEALQTRLDQINTKIEFLQKYKEEFEKKLKVLFFRLRFSMALLILTLNFIFALVFNIKYDEFIGFVVDFNSFLLLLYSLIAFVPFGDINRFKIRLEEIVKKWLDKKHLPNYYELEDLCKERDEIIAKLSTL